jgi:hypothetical protein
MAKKGKTESDESRLKHKISLRWKENTASDDSFRSLRKRLKRVQRKRRAMVARQARVAGKGTEGGGETVAAG